MTRFRTTANFHPSMIAGEKNTGKSMTQPNEVLSVREILDRYTRGLPINTGDVGYYDDPEGVETSDFDMMDKFEKEQYLRDQRSRLKSMQDSLNSSATKEQESAEGDKPQEREGQPPNEQPPKEQPPKE